MATNTTGVNTTLPAIPEPQATTPALLQTVQALKQAVEILSGATGGSGNAAATTSQVTQQVNTLQTQTTNAINGIYPIDTSDVTTPLKTGSIAMSIGDGVTPILTGGIVCYTIVPFGFTITGVSAWANAACSLEFIIGSNTYTWSIGSGNSNFGVPSTATYGAANQVYMTITGNGANASSISVWINFTKNG